MRNIEELDKLKGLTEIVTLFLNGNPFCDKFDGKESSYIRLVNRNVQTVIFLCEIENLAYRHDVLCYMSLVWMNKHEVCS